MSESEAPPMQFNEEVLRQGDVRALAQSADWTAAYMLTRLGPERAGALLTWARTFEQALGDRIRTRIAELARVQHQEQIQRWEQEALERSLRPASSNAAQAAPKKPEAVKLSMEDML